MTRYKNLTHTELMSCMELAKALTSRLNSEELFSQILNKISELLPAENWSLLLLDQDSDELYFEVSVNLDLDKVRGVRLRLGNGIAGKVALEQKPQVVGDVTTCSFFSSQVDQISGCTTRSIICVPLVFGGRTVGVIEVVNPKNLNGDPIPLLSIIADYAAIAIENMRRYREIQNLAIHDDLTGLYNTRYLYRTLGRLIKTAKDTGGSFSLIFMDIDHFKRVVDFYGHLKGSQAIQEIAGTLRECLLEPAFGVAYGGDEFVVVLQGFDKAQAQRKAREISEKINEQVYLANHGHQVRLSVSFGIATFPDDAKDVTGLLALADNRMFDAKKKWT